MSFYGLETYISVPGLLTLLSAAMLMAGGLALIASGNRTRVRMLSRRVDLVYASVVSAKPRGAARPTDGYLLPSPTQGMSGAAQRMIIRSFAKLGVTADRAPTFFVILRLVVMGVLGFAAFVGAGKIPALAGSSLMPVVIGAMVGIGSWFLPATIIAFGVKRRNKSVRSGLPDALELLVICVEAGLSLEDGLGRVVNELKRTQSALGDELELTLADLRILPSRDQALANLADRVDVPSVRSVVATLTQTLRYGTPLAQSLRVVASEMRNDFLIEMEERANRLPALLTLPVMLFLMPTIFLIVGGPAALKMIATFHH